MAKEVVNIGVSPNSGGDSVRAGGEKINSNFTELYDLLAEVQPVAFSGSYSDLTDKPTFSGDGTDLTAIQNDIAELMTTKANETDMLQAQADITALESGKSDVGHNHTGTYQPLSSILTNTTESFTTEILSQISALGSGVTDGDKGEVVVSSSGTVWSLSSTVKAEFATDEQGSLADSALQPGDITSGVITPSTEDVDFSAFTAAGIKALYESNEDTNVFTDSHMASVNAYASQEDYFAIENEFQVGDPTGSGDFVGVGGADALNLIANALQASNGVVSGNFTIVLSVRFPVYTRELTANSTLTDLLEGQLGQAFFLDIVQAPAGDMTFEASGTNFHIPSSGLDNDLTADSVTRYWIAPNLDGKHWIYRITEVA